MIILLTGGTGQLGSRLAAVLEPFAQIIAPNRKHLDLTDLYAVREAVTDIKPNLIVNAAGYSKVDGAEDEPDVAMALNARAPGALAEEAARSGAAIISYSSAYVFGGGKQTPYREDDQTGPLNQFGASKLAGENAIAAAGLPYLIFRCGWLYSARGRNFVTSVLTAGRENARRPIAAVSDQSGSPTPVDMVAEATVAPVKRGRDDISAFLEAKGGILHAACRGGTSWHGFAVAAADIARSRGMPWVAGEIAAEGHLDLPFLAERPKSSRLAIGQLEERFGFSPPNWRDALAGVVGQIVSDAS